MKRMLILIATVLSSGVLAQGATLDIGLLLPFTGQYDWVGANVQPVAQMIADEVNAAGGIAGAQIRLLQGDTEGTVDAGFTAAQKLINADGAIGLIGPTSLSIAGSQQLIIDNGVPIVSPTAGTTALDRFNTDYVFRTVPSDSLGGRAIARAATSSDFLGGQAAFQRPVLMVGKAPAMVSFEKPIQTSFADYGTPLVASLQFTPDKPSYRSEVQEALSEDPDAIVLVGSPEDSARIMQAAFQAGYEGTWFVTQDQTTNDYIALATPELVEGIFGLEEVADPESADLNTAFGARLMAYNGQEPQIFGTNTYDAMNVMVLAMTRAAREDGTVTRANVAVNIRAVSDGGADKVVVHDFTSGKAALDAGSEIDYQGLVGPIDFDEYGNITAPFAIKRVVDGAWTTVTILPADALE